jgi:hypothetical protein
VGRNALTTLVSRCGAILAVVVALTGIAGCTSNTRATVQVDSVSAGRICFTPENGDQTDLDGCWPISDGDAAGLEQGDCITAEIPHDPGDRVTAIRELDRACHVGVEASVSTGGALQNLLLLAVVPAAAVTFGVFFPRYRRRRAAQRDSHTAAGPPGPVGDSGEPTEVEVIEVSRRGRRSNR